LGFAGEVLQPPPQRLLFAVRSEIVVTSYSMEELSPLFLERETGLEPATSSLGSHAYIESKSLARFCCELLNLQRLAESAFSITVPPNEAQTRHVLHLGRRPLRGPPNPVIDSRPALRFGVIRWPSLPIPFQTQLAQSRSNRWYRRLRKRMRSSGGSARTSLERQLGVTGPAKAASGSGPRTYHDEARHEI
jgi:hypothetical protein